MSGRSLVICDQEEGYAAAFAVFLMKKKEFAFQVQVCNDFAQVRAVMKEHPIDILLIGGNYPAGEYEELQADRLFILRETGGTEAGENVIYKYQSGEAILSAIVCQCSKEDTARDIFFHTVKSRHIRIIGVFSPVHRSGKTTYALRTGQELAVSENVLYLNMEIYGGIGGHFPKEGHTLADALYYAKQESGSLGMRLTALVKHMGALDYLLPVRVSEDIKSVTLEEWTGLLHQIAEQSIYDVLILDIDEGLGDVYGILRMCTEIHVPAARDAAAKAKLSQMEEELHLLGYDDVKKKMVKKPNLAGQVSSGAVGAGRRTQGESGKYGNDGIDGARGRAGRRACGELDKSGNDGVDRAGRRVCGESDNLGNDGIERVRRRVCGEPDNLGNDGIERTRRRVYGEPDNLGNDGVERAGRRRRGEAGGENGRMAGMKRRMRKEQEV